jgi:hypothetical protein
MKSEVSGVECFTFECGYAVVQQACSPFLSQRSGVGLSLARGEASPELQRRWASPWKLVSKFGEPCKGDRSGVVA